MLLHKITIQNFKRLIMMFKPFILSAFLLMSGAVWANCSSTQIPIYHLKNNKVVDKGMGKQHFCASASGVAEGWDFKKYETTLFKGKAKSKKNKRNNRNQMQESYTVNRKKAAFIGQTVQDKAMRCLVFGRNEMLCNPYPNSSLKNKKVNKNKRKSRRR